jgi:integrase
VNAFKRGAIFHLDVRWRGYPRLRLSTGTTIRARALAMAHTLEALRDAGRRDLIGLLASRRLTLIDLHEAHQKRGDELEQLRARAESPCLGDLVEKWLDWLRSPAGISPRTRRRYSVRTVQQYAVSWEGFYSVLPLARRSRLADLTRGFVLDYRRARQRATGGRARKVVPGKPVSGATLNRDMAALGAFLTWVRDVEGLAFERPQLTRESESAGRERWLSAAELAAFERACPIEWWPFFATLFFTGARLGEAQGLRRGDVLLHAKRLTIHEAERRVKSRQSVRDLPVPERLESALAAHLARVEPGPYDLLFPADFQRYEAVRRVWDAVCKVARIVGATPHDARHTFAVHAAQAGVPIVRLQRLMGHATATMTMRYMMHAPEAYLSEDAAAIAAHMAAVGAKDAGQDSATSQPELMPA